MSCEIVLKYEDGTEEIINNAEGWKFRAGPITYNDIFNGETYDSRKEIPGWDMPEGESKYAYFNPVICEAPCPIIEPEMAEPIKYLDTVKPVKLTQPKKNVYVYDMGRNFAGIVKIRVKEKPGTRVRLRFAESLYEDGTVNQENLRWAKATDEYVCKGKGVEEWQPIFTYHGFRYVSIEGIKPNINTIEAYVVRSSVEKTGDFTCSNELLNKIQAACVHTEESNMPSVPTDCPQRDERMGWLNDCTVRIEEIVYNFGVSSFLRKWMRDIDDTQGEDGAIADVAPKVYGCDKADPLSSIFLFAPWNMYKFYGDKRIIEEQYDKLCAWEGYITSRSKDGIVEYSYYGDWASPVDNCIGGRPVNSANSAVTPGEFVSTVFYYQNARMLAKMAELIGRSDDIEKYNKLADYIKENFNRVYFHEDTAKYGDFGSQACQILPLHFGLVPDGKREAVLEVLKKDIEEHDNHLTTGNIATKYLFEVLSNEGLVDTAFEIATKEDYPSWGYMLSLGATTIWERWELGTTSAMNSHNHPMYCTISTWFYKHILGIKPGKPGFKEIIIAPKIPSKLESASGSLNTVAGRISVDWKQEDSKLILYVTVPYGTKATIKVPAGFKEPQESLALEGGSKIFEFEKI